MTTAARFRVATWHIATAIGVLTFAFRLINVRDLSNDHYMHLAWAQQLLFGEVPGRDFVDPGMPLAYLVSAFVQTISSGPFSEAVTCCLMLAVAAAVTFLVATEMTGSVAAGAGAAFVEVAFYPRLYSYPKLLVPAVALLLIQRYLRRPDRVSLVLMALWTGVAVLLRHDLGVYTAAGCGAALAWMHCDNRRELARAIAWYAAAVIVVMLPYVVFVQWTEGLIEHFHEAFEFAKGEAHQRFLAPPPFPFVQEAAGFSAWSVDDSAVLLFYVAHVAAVAALVLLVTSKARRPAVAAALAMLVLYLVVVLRHPIVSRIQDLAALLAIVGAWEVVESSRRGASARAIAAIVAVVSVASMWNLGSLTERFRDTRVADGFGTMARTIDGVKETGTQWPWERFWPAGEMPEAVRYLNACTSSDEAVLLTWAAPEYYFFAKRRFGAGHALFLPPDAFTTRHDQQRMLARMRRQRIPIVLINETRRKEFADAYGEVDSYLQQQYRAAGHFQIHEGSDVTIAVRRDLKPERTYGAERWPCGFDSRAANRTASIMLDGSATPLPAMSNAVP
jgi:hypothetical protein